MHLVFTIDSTDGLVLALNSSVFVNQSYAAWVYAGLPVFLLTGGFLSSSVPRCGHLGHSSHYPHIDAILCVVYYEWVFSLHGCVMQLTSGA